MKKLNPEKRRQLSDKAWKLYSEISMLLISRPSAQDVYELTPYEMLLRKYRMIRCVKLLLEFDLCEGLSEIALPDLDKVFEDYHQMHANRTEEGEYEIDEIYDYRKQLDDFGEDYLAYCLKDTGWCIHYIGDIEEYEELPPDVIQGCMDAVNYHWNALGGYEPEYLPSEYLTSLGCEPYDNGYVFSPDCNLILTNTTIKQMLRICEKHKEYKTWQEYREMDALRSFALFDRSFSDVTNYDLSERDWCCINYLLGRVSLERDEDVSMYLLNYEAVIFLMLADMVANEFMEKYHALPEKESAA